MRNKIYFIHDTEKEIVRHKQYTRSITGGQTVV